MIPLRNARTGAGAARSWVADRSSLLSCCVRAAPLVHGRHWTTPRPQMSPAGRRGHPPAQAARYYTGCTRPQGRSLYQHPGGPCSPDLIRQLLSRGFQIARSGLCCESVRQLRPKAPTGCTTAPTWCGSDAVTYCRQEKRIFVVGVDRPDRGCPHQTRRP